MASDRKEHSFRFSGSEYVFITDNGVFSKEKIDTGSAVLLDVLAGEGLQGSVLDLGCGYGVIGIILKKRNPSLSVLAVDVNPRAVELTGINAEKNQVDILARVSDRFENVTETFNTVITNPPIRAGKKVIYQMFGDAYAHLYDQGSLYVVIRRKQGAESAVKELKKIFGNCEIIARDKGYWILKSLKLTD